MQLILQTEASSFLAVDISTEAHWCYCGFTGLHCSSVKHADVRIKPFHWFYTNTWSSISSLVYFSTQFLSPNTAKGWNAGLKLMLRSWNYVRDEAPQPLRSAWHYRHSFAALSRAPPSGPEHISLLFIRGDFTGFARAKKPMPGVTWNS